MKFAPSYLQIETTTACNAHCPMCPRHVATRGQGVMDEAVFWKAVSEAYAMGVREISPLINGDPLADRRMPGFVQRLASDYPGMSVILYTNGSLLDEDVATALLSARNVSFFNVSMQGGNKATYEANTGLPWEVTLGKVKRAVELQKMLRPGRPLRMNMCVFSKTQDSVQDFLKLWGSDTDVCLGCFSNFGGLVHDVQGESPWWNEPRKVCYRALYHIYVYWNGDVGQCCFDLQNSIVYGNLKTQSLQQIVEGVERVAVQEAHAVLDVAGMPKCCVECNACKFNG